MLLSMGLTGTSPLDAFKNFWGWGWGEDGFFLDFDIDVTPSGEKNGEVILGSNFDGLGGEISFDLGNDEGKISFPGTYGINAFGDKVPVRDPKHHQTKELGEGKK